MSRPRFRLELEALDDDIAPVARLRQLLKQALRRFGLRAIHVAEVEGEEGSDSAQG